MDNRSVGELLRKQRLDLGLTQGAVAEALGLSQPGYSNIERGKVHLSSKYLDDVERVLHIKPAVLIEHLLGLANETERHIASDTLLTKPHRRLLLLMYGELTGRDSLKVAGWYDGAVSGESIAAASTG